VRKALVKSDKVAISNIETSNIDDVVRRAHTGDEVAVRALRHTFDASPDLWRFAGDLAVQSEQTWTALASSGHPIMKEAVSRHLATLRQELAGQAPTPLERLLVDRIVICQLQVYHADRVCADPNLTVYQRAFMERSLERAQRRYLSAIRNLATVRRLLLPAVQLNIGAQQLNVSGSRR